MGSQARAHQNVREPPEAGCETSLPTCGLGAWDCQPQEPSACSLQPASASLDPLPPPRDPLPPPRTRFRLPGTRSQETTLKLRPEPWKPQPWGFQTEFRAGPSRCKGPKPWGLQTEFRAGHSRCKGTVGADLARVRHRKEISKAGAGEGGLSLWAVARSGGGFK